MQHLRRSKRFALLFLLLLVGGASLFLVPLPDRALAPSLSRVVLSEDGSLLRAYLSSDEKWRFKTSSSSLPAHVVESLVCLEDKRFSSHPGIDPLAIGRATLQNVRGKRIVSGGSTLTMQLARLLEPRARTFSSKFIEAFRALQLEARFTKREILDLYLTYAPFGSNIEGLEAAAHRYFLKPARLLTIEESAFLLLLPQAPKRWDAKAAAGLKSLRDERLTRLASCGLVAQSDLPDLVAKPIPQWRSAFPRSAEHFADWVSGQALRATEIKTSVDRSLQASIEDLVANKEANLRSLGVVNVGIVAVDNATGKIRIAVGNFHFDRDGDSQKIASFQIARSTGSLLKPFLYGHLIETGAILPDSLLEDVPFDLNGYAPENYDGEFTGLVEAKLALSNSLNVPWVRALSEEGLDGFIEFLLTSGLKSPQKRGDLGASIAIGGLETRLLDLVMMYRAVANDGRLTPLEWSAHPRKATPLRWMNPATAHFIREALKLRGRPDFAIDPAYLVNPTVRWKTGTSQGNHDAWAIGFDPETTIGVWLGNLDNTASPALVGPELAAPLMFEAFEHVRRASPRIGREWSTPSLETVEVCAFSGLPATEACSQRKTVVGIPGLEVRHKCPYHQHALVDARTRLRITRECETAKMKPEVRSILDLPPDVASWANLHLNGAELAPAFHPACVTRPVAEGRLRILTPEAKTYVLHTGVRESRRGVELALPLKVKAAGGTSSWRCFLDGRPLTQPSNAFDSLVRVGPGDHDLLCSDQQGRSDRVAFNVEL